MKTGALIRTACRMGALCAAPHDTVIESIDTYGTAIGLAFQIVDDILDATSDTATLGKTAGKDARAGKVTYVSVHGLEAARRIARERSDSAIATLGRLPGDTGFLTWLAEDLVSRTH